MTIQYYRTTEVSAYSGLPRSSLYRAIQDGLFTKPVKISARGSAWPKHELDEIQNAKLSGTAEDGIRALVNKLHNKRSEAVK
ncbi:MAG: AlpA family phage regulatory protein [Methylococcales bacterium]|nr:AlpA family phage regulatory protein [Methylococcales bacterium]